MRRAPGRGRWPLAPPPPDVGPPWTAVRRCSSSSGASDTFATWEKSIQVRTLEKIERTIGRRLRQDHRHDREGRIAASGGQRRVRVRIAGCCRARAARSARSPPWLRRWPVPAPEPRAGPAQDCGDQRTIFRPFVTQDRIDLRRVAPVRARVADEHVVGLGRHGTVPICRQLPQQYALKLEKEAQDSACTENRPFVKATLFLRPPRNLPCSRSSRSRNNRGPVGSNDRRGS